MFILLRYGIMEKLKRLEAGEAVEDLLAEIDEEMPSMSEDEEEDDEDTGLTQVQKKVWIHFSNDCKNKKSGVWILLIQ